jgi:hypothetical protein
LQKADIVTAFAGTKTIPFATLTIDIIFDVQAVVFLPYKLSPCLFQWKTV